MNSTFEYNGYSGSIEISFEDNCLHGKILFITDLVSYEADTLLELKQEFILAVDDYIATCAEINKKPEKAFKGSFNVRVSPELHKLAAVKAYQEGISLNELTFRAIDNYVNKPESQPLTVVNNHYHGQSVKQVGTYSEFGEEEWTIKQTQPQLVH